MSRCPITRGRGSLACCRVAEHPTDDGRPEHAGCCLHSVLMGGVELHAYGIRGGNGHPLACATGIALDTGTP